MFVQIGEEKEKTPVNSDSNTLKEVKEEFMMKLWVPLQTGLAAQFSQCYWWVPGPFSI